MAKNYFREQTLHAIENFPFPLPPVHLDLIYAIATVKKATASANGKAGLIPKNIAKRIQQTCDKILLGKYNDQFITCSLQGGAGTSMHMNVNEVIATLAKAHPNDHVNKSQSTNDVNPTALKLASLLLSKKLLKNITYLEKIIQQRAKEYKNVQKLARTHFQDAVPTTVGEEFLSYTAIIERDRKRIEKALLQFYEINLGGTAIGNSINAPKEYRKYVYQELQKITGMSFRAAANFMSQTSSQSDFADLSSAITLLFLDLSKIATDIRFMCSGPNGGIGEITLPPLQKGSSIMPGKVNPVIPESINQAYFLILGKDLTIKEAAQHSCLELGIMFPILADSLITSIKVATVATKLFADKCIATLQVNKEKCKELLENSTAYATLLTPILGYDTVTELVQESITTHIPFITLIKQKHLLSDTKLHHILSI